MTFDNFKPYQRGTDGYAMEQKIVTELNREAAFGAPEHGIFTPDKLTGTIDCENAFSKDMDAIYGPTGDLGAGKRNDEAAMRVSLANRIALFTNNYGAVPVGDEKALPLKLATMTNVSDVGLVKPCLLISAVFVVVLLLTARWASALTPANMSVTTDVVYCQVGKRQLHLDIIRPKVVPQSEALPVVVCIHGGGWSSGNKKDVRDFAYGVAQLGIEVLAVEYRLSSESRFPSQFDDVKAAVEYARNQASQLQIDPNRIAAVGMSAGGHLALLLAERNADGLPASKERPSLVCAAVSMSGPTDLTRDIPLISKGVVNGLIGKSITSDRESFRQASPIYNLSPYCSPLLLIHGENDAIVPYGQAVRMSEAAKKLGVSCELETLHHAGHSGVGADKKELHDSILKIASFLKANLKANLKDCDLPSHTHTHTGH